MVARNDDTFELKFRIEVWLNLQSQRYYATIARGFLADLHITSQPGRLATEQIWTNDDLLSNPDALFPNETDALNDAIQIITREYEDIPAE